MRRTWSLYSLSADDDPIYCDACGSLACGDYMGEGQNVAISLCVACYLKAERRR